MNKKIVLVIFLFHINLSYTQINIGVEDWTVSKALLYFLEGENTNFIDSVSSDNQGNFQFNLSDKHSGFYRLRLNSTKWLNFIYDNEEIELETNGNFIIDSLKIIKSESNKIYYEFVKLSKDYKTKTELLQLILARYPTDDDFYQTTIDELNNLQEEYLYFINVTAQENPNSFIARYVRNAQLPVLETYIPIEDQLRYLKTHALDNVNFYDDGLVYSNAFTSKTIEYLSYYRNPQLPKELLEKEFMVAVDTILSKAKVNEIVYQHIVEYLINGFKEYSFENVIDYIVENYVIEDDICLHTEIESSLDRRINQAKYFKVGIKVPDIVSSDTSGKQIELSKIDSEQILILFYASWCPHCAELIANLKHLYENQNEKTFEVFAVSIDTVRTDWQNFVKTNNLSWINVSDLNGWDGKAVKEYYLYSTPTMFLVDSKLSLLAKPRLIDQVHDWF